MAEGEEGREDLAAGVQDRPQVRVAVGVRPAAAAGAASVDSAVEVSAVAVQVVAGSNARNVRQYGGDGESYLGPKPV